MGQPPLQPSPVTNMWPGPGMLASSALPACPGHPSESRAPAGTLEDPDKSSRVLWNPDEP
eukprot:947097-Pyramimonas_sp.AAC.1